MKGKPYLKVFIQEDDKAMKEKISEELKNSNYVISFFSKSDYSAFELLNFNPDIIIQDYKKNKVVNCYQWTLPYNN